MPVAADTQVGPPRSLQWVAPPLWLRSHETPSGIEGLVSSAGRIFYFLDEGLIGITDQRLPERWSLVCRDAFNGKLLWKRPVGRLGLARVGRRQVCGHGLDGNPRRPHRGARREPAAAGGRRRPLYATLGFRSPLSILDAASGEVVATVEGTRAGAGDAGQRRHRAGPLARSAGRRRQTPRPGRSQPVPLDRRRGPDRQGAVEEGDQADRLAAAGHRPGTRHLPGRCDAHGLDLRSGRTLWTVDGPQGNGRTLIAHQGFVLVYAAERARSREGTSGNLLWSQEVPGSSGGESEDLFVVDGVVWRGMIPVDGDLKPVGKSADAMALGFDLRTGEESGGSWPASSAAPNTITAAIATRPPSGT